MEDHEYLNNVRQVRRRRFLALWMLMRARRRALQRRRFWVHPINSQRRRLGEFHHLVQELAEHPERYERYVRMSKNQYEEILEGIRPLIEKQDTNYMLKYEQYRSSE